jgi:hypothetical protein
MAGGHYSVIRGVGKEHIVLQDPGVGVAANFPVIIAKRVRFQRVFLRVRTFDH